MSGDSNTGLSHGWDSQRQGVGSYMGQEREETEDWFVSGQRTLTLEAHFTGVFESSHSFSKYFIEYPPRDRHCAECWGYRDA